MTSTESTNLHSHSGLDQHGGWTQPIEYVAATLSNQPASLPAMAASIRASIENAGRINQTGAIALASGDIPAAMVAFRGALQYLEGLAPFAYTGAGGVANDLALPVEPVLGAIFESNPSPLLEAVGVPGLEDGYMYIYSNAIDFFRDAQTYTDNAGAVSPGVVTDESRFAFQVSFYSAIVMFNIALCKHKRGLNFRDQSSLRAAIHLYSMVYQTLCNIPITDFSDKLILLILALWNNQSQVYWLLESYGPAKEMLENVRRLAAHLLTERRTSLDEIDQGHIFEFILNVIIAELPTSAACA
jgi:tetratricopeptide (TPR) repeat protein